MLKLSEKGRSRLLAIQASIENGPRLNLLMSSLALTSGLESVAAYSFDGSIFPRWFDLTVFTIFTLELVAKFSLYFVLKWSEPQTTFKSLYNRFFISIDIIALIPDAISLIIGTDQMNLKTARVLRAIKIIRLLRIVSNNKRIIASISNLLQYRLYGSGLIIFVNTVFLVLLGFAFSLFHFEYEVYIGKNPTVIKSLQWGFEILIMPFGLPYEETKDRILKSVAAVASVIGLLVFASIIGVCSELYQKIFRLIDEGVNMTKVRKGDLVIVGWNHLIPNLIRHAIDHMKHRVVVVAGYDKSLIRKKLEDIHSVELFQNPMFEYVNLDYSNQDLLRQLKIDRARKIVIVYDEDLKIDSTSPQSSGNARDARIMFTLKKIRHLLANSKEPTKPSVICEIFRMSNKELFDEYPDVEIICKESLFANVFSQSVIHDDVLNIYKKLLRTEGKEIYLLPVDSIKKQLTQRSVGSALMYFEYLENLSRAGYGLMGIYFKNLKGGKSGVVISPSESELNTLDDRFDPGSYQANLILLAEDVHVVETIRQRLASAAA